MAFFKVRFMAEPENEKTHCYNEAGENNQKGILDSGYIAAGVVLVITKVFKFIGLLVISFDD